MKINLQPVDFTFKLFWKGTYRQFGFKSWLTLASPLMNTLLNWKYRNWTLDINEESLEKEIR